MSTALTVQQPAEVARPADELTEIQRMAKMFVASGYFADARDVAQAGVKILAGRELGVPPIASMMGINIIKGKVALGATLIASRIRVHGYEYEVKRLDDKGCTIAFWSKLGPGGRKPLGDSSFTAEDFKAANITSDMYKKFPRNMYFSRAISNGARWYTPEIFGGSPVYSPDELGAQVDEQGEYLEQPTAPPQRETQQQVAERRIAEETAKAKPAPSAADEFADMEKRMREQGKFERLAIFADLKKRLQRVTNKEKGEEKYYEILGQHDVMKSDQFKTADTAIACAKDMLGLCIELEQASKAFDIDSPPFAADDSDLPDFGGDHA